MKKGISLLLAASISLGLLAACGDTGGTDGTTTSAATTTAQNQTEDPGTETGEGEGTPTTAEGEETEGPGSTGEGTTEDGTTEDGTGGEGALSIRGADGTDEEHVNIVTNTLEDSYLGDPFDTVIPSHYDAYPMEGNPTIDVWMPIDGFLASLDGDLNNFYVYEKAMELTGINVNFISPAAGTEDDNFTIMTSSRDSLPDVIVQADRYPGGLEAGLEDGAYIDLTEHLEEWAPNYAEFREADETRRRVSITDSGKVLGFHGLSPYPEWIWFGLLIKEEALEATGMEVPETIADWESFLEAAQEAGYTEPLNYGSDYGQIFTDGLNGAYGVYDWRFIDEDGQVQWGPAQEGAKDYLAMMRDWQSRGFFNPDWTSADYNARMSHASSDKAAAMFDSPDTMWGVWRTDNGIEFVGAPNPVLNEGDTSMTTYRNWTNTGNPAAITTNAENVEAAMRWLDFGYSKKGWELFNYGEYGKTHLINEEGMPYYHEDSVMFNDPDGHPMAQLVWKYRVHAGPNIRDEHNSNPLIANEESYSGDIRQMWTETQDASPAFPPVSLTQEEAAREASLGAQLATLRGEYFAKIIMGELPLEAYDEFLQQAETIGLEEWLQVNQAGVDRYFQR